MHNELMETAVDTLLIRDFPQLQLIAWNRDPHDTISGEEAFDLYERNWRFVDENAMLPHEKILLERLMREYGHGILHV